MAKQVSNVIIGAGPGGYVAAIRLAQLGQSVLVIDKAPTLGGTCLNWGCIPSKALIHAATLYESMTSEAESMGITAKSVSVDLSKVMAWKDGVVTKLTGGIAQLFKHHNIERMQGTARFSDANTLDVALPDGSEETVRFEQCIIATGSSSVALPHLPMDGEVIIDSDQAVNLTEVPKHLVLVGGGVIGLELGVFYAKLGAQVTVVEMQDQLLPGMDPDVVAALTRSLKKRKNVTVLLNSKVTEANVDKGSATLTVETPKGVQELKADKVLVAVGRRPNTRNLALAKAGLTADEKGFVPADDQLRTAVPNIFAIGDVTRPPLLAHKASKEGLVAAAVIAGQPERLDVRAMPGAVFTDPEVATVGLTEAEAKEQGFNVTVGQFPFAASGRALTMNHGEGLTKIITDSATDQILGIHMVGPHVAELLAEATLAIEMGATAEDLALTVHAHPTLSEGIMEAAEAVHGLAIHAVSKSPAKKLARV